MLRPVAMIIDFRRELFKLDFLIQKFWVESLEWKRLSLVSYHELHTSLQCEVWIKTTFLKFFSNFSVVFELQNALQSE